MSNHLLAKVTSKKTLTTSQSIVTSVDSPLPSLWMLSTGTLFVLLIGLTIYSKLKFDQLTKQLKFEELKNREFRKRLDLALHTISKIEANPDLANSREVNLEYLRMRMDEQVFHFAIVNQVKIKVNQIISIALRPNKSEQAVIGIASISGRQVDEIFDITYERGVGSKHTNRVLFRIQVKLVKLPTQASSTTITQIIDCIETFLSPQEEHNNWQPTIQGRLAKLHWEQKAKPTPLLVLEQMGEGVNVTMKVKRNIECESVSTNKKLSEVC